MKRKGRDPHSQHVCEIYTQDALTKGKLPNAAMEEYLKKRLLPIMLCTNWVCAGTFVDHEWLSESTISKHVEEVLGMELDYEIGIPCVVQWSMLWFSAATRLHGILESTSRLSTWRSWKHFRDHLEESIHQDRACWRLWQRFFTKHTDNGESTKRWQEG